MKRMLALLLVLMMLVPMGVALAEDQPELSRDIRFGVGMTLYAKPRVEANGANPKNLNGFSATTIQRMQGTNNYGLYFKFTPRASIQASRVDFYIHVPNPGEDYQMGWDGEMDLPRNYYRYWEFLSLQDMFDRQISTLGYVVTGTYTMDLYLDYAYAGQVQFKVGR